MTWQRLVNRNGLGEGDYGTPSWKWAARVNVDSREPIPPGSWDESVEDRDATTLRTTQDLSNARADRVLAYEKASMLLLGDLRRLESDARDEDAVCRYIAQRTGIDAGVVAAVLKEFIEW
jgi:hypothetical protein